MKKKIVFTGGSGRFGSIIKTVSSKYKLLFPSKKELDITNLKNIKKYFQKSKPNYVVHMAGLSRPMKLHEEKIDLSIRLNIIGTSNIVIACAERKVKLIYFSSSYVYPGKKGNYKEDDPVKPEMNYSRSKLGGECAVSMYDNSLILRLCMTDYPFTHKKAISAAYSSFIYNKYVAMVIPYLLNEKGIINIGGKKREIYQFAKKFSSKSIKKIPLSKVKNFPKDSSVKIDKFLKVIKKYKLKKIIL